MALDDVQFRSNPGILVRALIFNVFVLTLLSWRHISRGGVMGYVGWFLALATLVLLGIVVLKILRPPTLLLTSSGFVMTSPLFRRPLKVRWADIDDLGLYWRKRLTLWGEAPVGPPGVAFSYKPGRMPKDEEGRALRALSLTGWHGVVVNIWNVPTDELLAKFRRYLEASRSDGAR